MDPISVIGLLASLSSLIQASNTLLNVMRSIKDAEKEILELYNDVSVFEEALKGFDRVLRSRQTRHNISTDVIDNALQEGSATIQDLGTRLVQIFKCKVSAVCRIKWAQQKSSLKWAHERLKGQSTMLQSFLALAHAETFLVVCSEHPQFLQLYSTTAEDDDNDTLSVQGSFVSESTTLYSDSSSSSLRRNSVDTTASSIESSSSSIRKSTFKDSIAPPMIQVVDVDAKRENHYGTHLEPPGKSLDDSSVPHLMQVDAVACDAKYDTNQVTKVEPPGAELSTTIRRACRFDCYCKCHLQTYTVYNKCLSKINTPKQRCTEPTCQAAKEPEDVARGLPDFFRKALSQVMSSKSIKVRYELNTFRMVSEGSDAIRHVKHGNLERLKTCFQTGEATLWDTAPDGWSLLHTAAYNRQLPIVRYLLDLGANTEVADVGTRKPADLAILKSLGADATYLEQEIVEVFSQKDDYISDLDFTPIHIALLELYHPTDRERPSLEQLLNVVDDANNAPAGTDWAKWKMRYRKRSPLFSEIVELFRASAANKLKTHKVIHHLIDQKDQKYCWTPLHWANSAGRTDKMKILIDHGANPFLLSNLDANILHAAAESKALNGLAEALDIWRRNPRQLNINQANRWGETPLHVASWGSFACVSLLLQAGADRNARQEDGQVPLHCAGLSERGELRRDIVALLCAGDSGPHINAQDVDGRPPIFDFLDDPECMEILISNGVRLDLTDNTGKNLFHHACIQNEGEALEMLLRLSPNTAIMKDRDGNIPLIHALRCGSDECAMALLRLDNVGDVVGQDGWAAVHGAVKWGNADVLETVLMHPSFVRGATTNDGKTIEVVAMETENWCGKVKELVRKYNSVT